MSGSATETLYTLTRSSVLKAVFVGLFCVRCSCPGSWVATPITLRPTKFASFLKTHKTPDLLLKTDDSFVRICTLATLKSSCFYVYLLNVISFANNGKDCQVKRTKQHKMLYVVCDLLLHRLSFWLVLFDTHRLPVSVYPAAVIIMSIAAVCNRMPRRCRCTAQHYQVAVNPFNTSCSKLLLLEGFSAKLV